MSADQESMIKEIVLDTLEYYTTPPNFISYEKRIRYIC